MEGGGPINDIGFDDQPRKRMIQDRLNRRLAMYFLRNSALQGGLLVLSGVKLAQSVLPYKRMEIGKRIVAVEQDPIAHSIIWDLISQDYDTYGWLYTVEKPCDILEIALQEVADAPEYWRGFDFDFDVSLSEEKLNEIEGLLDTIQAPAFWLRIIVTARPVGHEITRQRLASLGIYLGNRGNYIIDDMASGPVFTYHDTAPMAALQLICSRR
jgi:hypothetical protein